RQDRCWEGAHGLPLIFKPGHGASEERPVSLMTGTLTPQPHGDDPPYAQLTMLTGRNPREKIAPLGFSTRPLCPAFFALRPGNEKYP
ncbi:hypothetical protein KUCAC02_017341, partial [Chaenocephalus aceratus]